MPGSVWFAVPGVAIGLALACVVAAFARPAPVRLAAAVARLEARGRLTDSDEARLGRCERLLLPVAVRAARSTNRWWGIPSRDLAACELTPTQYLERRAAWTGAGIVLTLVLWLLLVAAQVSVPPGLLVLAICGGAVAGSAVPVLELAETTRTRRDEFRRAIAAWLKLVAQERASGAAAGPALLEAARAADSWPFQRLHAALVRAQHTGDTPWDALTQLGTRMGVAEAGDVADIAATAADGAAVYTTLTTKSRSLRRAILAADKADANSRSQRLALPVTLLLVGFLLLVIYPAFSRLLGM